LHGCYNRFQLRRLGQEQTWGICVFVRISTIYKPPRFPLRGSLSQRSPDRRHSCSRCRQSCDTVSDKICIWQMYQLLTKQICGVSVRYYY